MADLDFSRAFSGASPVLASLAPIPVVNNAAGGQLEFRPLSAVTPVSSQPEAIMAGLGQGAESIAKGYFGAIMQKKQDAKDEEERKRKANLEERRMKVEEGRFALEKDKFEKERQDRINAVGADKFPEESGQPPTQATQAPTTEATPTPVVKDASQAVSNQISTLVKSPEAISVKDPFKYQREVSPSQENPLKFQSETPQFQGSPLQMPAPERKLEIVPKALSGPIAPVTPKTAAVSDTSTEAPADGIPKNLAQEKRQRGFSPDPGDENLPPSGEAPIVTAGKQFWGWLNKVKQGVEQSDDQGMAGTPWGPGGARYKKPDEAVVQKPTVPSAKPLAGEGTPSAPQASYTFPSAPFEQLQQAASPENLRSLAPYVAASADVGNGAISTDKPVGAPTAPSLPLTGTSLFDQQEPPKGSLAPQLYNLDMSQYNKAPEVVPQQRQSAEQSQAVSQDGNPFSIPPRPTADQIPKDYNTRDYEAARREQAKDYGFYYEPMGRIETHKDAKGQWYKVIRDPEKASILEQKLGRLESMRQRYDKFQLQQQNTIDREQTKFFSNPDVKAFTAPNGMRQSFGRFVKDYDAILKNPEASGISDIGLLDMFGRAEGGGRITEGQAALALSAMGITDKPEVFIQKLQGGAKLSQPQRDQMLRVIAEDHAFQANTANQQIEMVRNKLIKQGITDESMLPQPYIVPITKWDFQEKMKSAQAENMQLQLQKAQALRDGDSSTVNQIDQRLKEITQETTPLLKMAKRIGFDKNGELKAGILNAYEMEHTPQGWAGGAVATFQQQEP